MKELTFEQVKDVNGGIAPVVAGVIYVATSVANAYSWYSIAKQHGK